MIQSNNNSKSINPLLIKLVNWGTLFLFIIVVIGIYYIFFYKASLRYEPFENIQEETISSNLTIYESSLNNLFGNNPILLCNMLPTLASTACVIDGKTVVKSKFPVHMIKLIDGSVIGVFNDGRLYTKDDIMDSLWSGPLDNSLINNIIPLRMITLNSDLSSLLGVGYDNKLYSKDLDSNGQYDKKKLWKQIPNNNDIIYVIFDRDTHYLVSIDINGKLFIKSSTDLTSKNFEVNNLMLDRPILKLYYDMYGYMLAIDNKFNLYQFKEKDWKTSPLNLERGTNQSQLQDIIYYNDGKLFGLVFDINREMLLICKQTDIYYLSNFVPIDKLNSTKNISSLKNFVLTDSDVIQNKIGYINPILFSEEDNAKLDQDTSFAFHKQNLENQKKLRDFCKSRYDTTTGSQQENYELLSEVEQNKERITKLKGILDNLIEYDPDKIKIQENYPNLYPINNLAQ